MTTSKELDAVFAALAHPTRRDILAQLANGAATVKALAAPCDMSLPAVSKHIKVLEDAGLITRGRDAQFRPCTLNAAPLQAVARWTDAYRPIWEARFDQMDTILQTMKDKTDE